MDWKELGNVAIRSISSLILLFFLTRMLGKKQITQLSLFDYIIGISMGSIAAEMAINREAPFFSGVTSMCIYAFVAYGISYLTIKSIKIRRFVTGVPIILINKGKILEDALKKALIDINDLLEESRSCGYFDLNDVEYAIMETSGKISFLPKVANRPVTPDDLSLKPEYEGVVANVIIDSKIMINNLKALGKTEDWLVAQIKKQGHKDLDNILLVTIDAKQKMTIYEKIKSKDIKTFLE